jgi:DNA-directed RNA polymerase alpha subunit/DNA-directed RNA polymerase subunit L
MFVDHKVINPQRIQFTIKDIELSIVNAIRRIILSELPNVAFYFDPYDVDNNDIVIKNNNSVLHNEFLAHRISLIPIHFHENEINDFKPDDYRFILKKKNTLSSQINITTKDIEIFNNNDEKYDEKFRERLFPKNKITNDYILITKLKPNLYEPQKGEEIDIEFKGSINIAKKHSRWCPTSQSCYYNKIDEELASSVFKEKVIEQEKTKGSKLSEDEVKDMKSKFDALDIYRYFKKNKFDEPNEFIFQIESECRMRPNYLFFKGLIILISKLENFITNLTNNHDSINITQMGNVDNFYQIGIKNEDHTLINVLQTLIYKQHFQRSDVVTNKILEYIGFYQPHPLDNLMYLKLKFSVDIKADKDFTKTFMIDSINKIIQDLHIITKEWVSFVKLDSSDIIEVQNYIKS